MTKDLKKLLETTPYETEEYKKIKEIVGRLRRAFH